MMSDRYWKIDRYARFCAGSSDNRGQWIHYDDSTNAMALTIMNGSQLVISQGSSILESHSLLCAQAWMRGLCRNDSLLFVCKVQVLAKTETRKFRVRFCAVDTLSGVDQCRSCVHQLQQFFSVKMSVVKPAAAPGDTAQNKSSEAEMGGSSKHEQSLMGEVTLGDVAQAVVNSTRLPLAYAQHHVTSPETLQQMVRVCLADPAFPAFVDSVEEALKQIVKD